MNQNCEEDWNQEFYYETKYQVNQVITGTGRVCVVTGWLNKKLIQSKLNNSSYAAIGNLYSPSRGISFLVRNLLVNAHVTSIVILESTKEDIISGSSRCLFDFFNNGVEEYVGDDGVLRWKIISSIEGFIDIEIKKNSIDYLRENIVPILVKDVNSAVNAVNAFTIKFQKAPMNSSSEFERVFPVAEIVSKIKPNVLCGHIIRGENIADTWVNILHRIRTSGTIRQHGHGGNWQELIDVMVVVNNEPPDLYFPDPNFLPVNREFIDGYIPTVLYDSPYIEGIKYTYGQRIRSWFNRDQVEQVISKLATEIDAASAVISLWDVADHEMGSSPCLNHIWFRVNSIPNHGGSNEPSNEPSSEPANEPANGCEYHSSRLSMSMTATFRSNDMFGAWVSNAMALKALQLHVIDALNEKRKESTEGAVQAITCGELITISQSAHIYDDCWENTDSLIKTQYTKLVKKIDYYDPIGNFIIEVIDSDRSCVSVVDTVPGASIVSTVPTVPKPISVTHTHPDSGVVVGVYTGGSPLRIFREILNDVPSMLPAHAAYLATELVRASECISESIRYIQDN